MLKYWKLHKFPLLFSILSIALYLSFGYDLQRTDFIKLITLYVALFYACIKLIQFKKYDFKFLLVVGVLCRLAFLVATPNLSQDFYRFIWDGQLILSGINPYQFLPNNLIQQADFSIPNAQQLYDGMGWLSAEHYSNYPPLAQVYFMIIAFLGFKSVIGSIVAMRIMLLFADLGILYFGRKILAQLNLPAYNIFWYFLNPLIIIELTGNLHFESLMLLFLVVSAYLLLKNNWWLSAIAFAGAVLTKLIPLLFLPVFFKFLGWKKALGYYCIVGIITLGFFVPFTNSTLINNYSDTIGLWFTNFEFNASIYYVVREIGYTATGYNIIQTVGKVLPLITLAIALGISFFRKNNLPKQLLISMVLCFTVYLLFSTTVHPWYLASLVLLSSFTTLRFGIAWSVSVVLSYFAYSSPNFKENLWLISLEYFIVAAMLYLDFFIKKRYI
jgi:hypothetical protein